MVNRLVSSSSPYLQQHAGNPIDWQPWGPEAFAEARLRDVPVLVSIGYAACHWCHVMAEETFEDESVARLVNRRFVAIKVDREDQPDVDAVFLNATQSLTGQGGWPMTVFCTPQGQPFFAGTYFPPRRQGHTPSFTEVVTVLAEAWAERRDEVLSTADAIVAQLAEINRPSGHPDPVDVWALLGRVADDYDLFSGGFGQAPKFPAATLLDALLIKGEATTLDMAQRTLDAMARGALFDQLGGGFHRYCVDPSWVKPHFEKMLYDNALLLGAYTHGWRRTPEHDVARRTLYQRVVRKVVAWLHDQMLTAGGGLASSLDADSSDIRGMAHEGIYYLWNPDLLRDVLDADDAEWAMKTFQVTGTGTAGFGYSTLQLHVPVDYQRLDEVSERLLEVRRTRFAPARDDKVVASWNGWAIDSLVTAALVFGEPDWLSLARRIAESLWRDLWVAGSLRHSARDQQANAAPGTAEDYGALAGGFAGLAGAIGESVWLDRAVTLLDKALVLFRAEDGGFYDATHDYLLFARPRVLTDQPTPSGTSSMIAALRRVALMAQRPDFLVAADAAATTVRSTLVEHPRFCGAALADALLADGVRQGLAPAVVVVIDPEGDPLNQLSRGAWRMAPFGSVIMTGHPGTTGFAQHFDARIASGGRSLAFVCRGETCFTPTADLAELRDQLWRRC